MEEVLPIPVQVLVCDEKGTMPVDNCAQGPSIDGIGVRIPPCWLSESKLFRDTLTAVERLEIPISELDPSW